MRRRSTWLVMSLLVSVFLKGCALSDHGTEPQVAAVDRLIPMGLIYVAEDHLKALGFDPGPVDGMFTEQTAEAIRQYQRRYGLVVSGLLDSATRSALGIEKPPSSGGG